MEEVFTQRLKEKYDLEAIAANIEGGNKYQNDDVPLFKPSVINPFDQPDFVYRGMVFSDGIIESNIKVIPQITESHSNASNMFK